MLPTNGNPFGPNMIYCKWIKCFQFIQDKDLNYKPGGERGHFFLKLININAKMVIKTIVQEIIVAMLPLIDTSKVVRQQ